MDNQKIYCQICGRQIVSYKIDNDVAIGPASDGCLMLVNGVACPKCTPEEKLFQEIMEGRI